MTATGEIVRAASGEIVKVASAALIDRICDILI